MAEEKGGGMGFNELGVSFSSVLPCVPDQQQKFFLKPRQLLTLPGV